jgi:hypothetical protein
VNDVLSFTVFLFSENFLERVYSQMISEKIELLCKGLYNGIPDVLTLKSIPTASELDQVGAEDFDKTMIEKILPQAIEEKINFYDLYEMDYQWVCRCLRIVNYGPYYTTDRIMCSDCGKISWGEYRVNLNSIECKPLPADFKSPIKIPKESFIDQKHDVEIVLPTIKQIRNAYNDKAFQNKYGETNRELAKICYTVKSIGGKTGMTPLEVKLFIQNNFSAADYILLKNTVYDATNYGLRAGGTAQCPKCGSTEATFIAFADDRFFRPTVGDLLAWKADKS